MSVKVVVTYAAVQGSTRGNFNLTLPDNSTLQDVYHNLESTQPDLTLPAIFHSLRMPYDYRYEDLPLTLALRAISPGPNGVYELELINRTKRVQEIELRVLQVEREYWYYVQALKYLTAPGIPRSDDEVHAVERERDEVLEELTGMGKQWRDYTGRTDVGEGVFHLGVEMRRQYVERISCPADLKDKFLPLVREIQPDTYGSPEQAPSGVTAVTEADVALASSQPISFSFLESPAVYTAFKSTYSTKPDPPRPSRNHLWNLQSPEEQLSWFHQDIRTVRERRQMEQEYEQEYKAKPSHPAPTPPPSSIIISKTATTFNITSSTLLYGHLTTLLHAHLFPSSPPLTPSTVPPPLEGGTIMQHVFATRTPARNGKWKVSKVRENATEWGNWSDREEDFEDVGWVVYHEDVDPVECMRRCAFVNKDRGISNGNQHVDKGVIYINRYDWGYHWAGDRIDEQFVPALHNFLRPSFPDDADLKATADTILEDHRAGHFFAVDGSHLDNDFVNSVL
ncbi:hypothetical protein HDV00_008088, partial [Rhizophlyctis rosea]